MRRLFASALLAALLATGCGDGFGDTPQSFGLRLIGQQTVSDAQTVGGTRVGGLSGLDYDIAGGTWILISDDRSEKNPARFYTARLRYDAAGFSAVQWCRTTISQAPRSPSCWPSKWCRGRPPAARHRAFRPGSCPIGLAATVPQRPLAIIFVAIRRRIGVGVGNPQAARQRLPGVHDGY
ncbi:esterase-like activity of phytase family protein [Xylophilus ampelinus]|uniref:Phytase-like protein with esterase activity n=1 Tax=Xylophilus ampelinus TaxID=54067 RepID=A0A318SQX4_9BURK|nr:esterase-like activity of phytase family protein [Xylophilus ampelinus]MCS4511308.1 esterase-like activity of phytase family protein [Xylophilus ampelinus]PYE74960.1 phytase-like protein with esterase activity [Xylophilus ampelinus]